MKTMQKNQSGVVILEVLVSIVIFAVGVLGIVGLQTVTAKAGIDARFRTEAAALADELVARAQIWTNPATLATNFQGDTNVTTYVPSGGTEFLAWFNDKLARTSTGLPRARGTVTFPTPYAGGGVLMAVQISWQAPGSEFAAAHTTVAALPGGS